MNNKKLDCLDELITEQVNSATVLGANLFLEHKGEVVYKKCYGSDHYDSIYKIFSMSKPVTAIAAMILFERGLLDLEDPLSKYLPAFGEAKVVNSEQKIVPAQHSITIKHLLNMTSGIVYAGEEEPAERLMLEFLEHIADEYKGNKPLSSYDFFNRLGSVPLAFEPGSGWRYGASADVLGAVIEVIAKKSLGEFLNEEIFQPLEMYDTSFYLPEEKAARLAKMYTRVDTLGHLQPSGPEQIQQIEHVCFRFPGSFSFESGGAGLYSTIEDYSHLAKMLLNEGTYKGKEILGKKTVEFMRTNHLTPSQQQTIYFDSIRGYSYSQLMRIMVDVGDNNSNGSMGEYGWDGLPGTYFLVDPKESLIFVYMQQIAEGADQSLRRKMRQIIYGAL